MGRWIDSALAGALVVVAAVGSLRWLDAAAYPVVVLQTGGPFVLVGLVLVAVATALLRRWRLLAAASVALGVALAIAVPELFSHASPRASKDLTVMSANLREGKADPTQLMAAVRAREVDVLVLVEVTPEAVEGLRAKGLDEYFTASAGEAREDSTEGTLVFSRHPLEQVVDLAAAHGVVQPEVVVDVEGTPVSLRGVHVHRPTSSQDAEPWRDSLRALEDWTREQEGPVVLAGDFSADSGHPAFRALTSLAQEAHDTAGRGWVNTWPVVGHRLPPFVQPDHVLGRGLTLVEVGDVAIHGTDHAVVWASYSLTTDG